MFLVLYIPEESFVCVQEGSFPSLLRSLIKSEINSSRMYAWKLLQSNVNKLASQPVVFIMIISNPGFTAKKWAFLT